MIMMKNSNRYTKGWLVALFVLLTTLCRAESYTVTTAGTLSSLVGDKKNSITELTLSGQLNGTDFAFIREMSALKKLDMLNTEIVAGGDPYVYDRITADDILPSAVFCKWYGEMLAPLESVVLPKDITIIESEAFSGLETLKTVTLPEGLVSMGNSAFQSTGLTTVTFPSTLQVIDGYAFYNCDNLTSIHIPASLQEIGEAAFVHCDNLATVTVDAANQHFAVQDNVLFTKDMKELLYYCCGLKTESYAIPEGVVKVGNGAFHSHPILRQVTFPSTLKAIDENAFNGCGLTSLELPAALQEIGNYAFNCCYSLTSLHLPASLQEIGYQAFAYCYNLATVTVDAANQHFVAQDNVLYTKDMKELLLYPVKLQAESYVIPEGVIKIRSRAFVDQPALKQVTLPSTLQELEEGAFMNVQLKEVILPDACQRIGGEVFAYNHALTTVSIPGNLQDVGYAVFRECEQIAEITCKSRKPYSIEDDFFGAVDYTTCKLYVPAGRSAAYRAAPVWSNFTNIVEQAMVEINGSEANVAMGTAGELTALLGEQADGLTKLTIEGPINGDDVRCFRHIQSLKVLDLRKANIVAGGTYDTQIGSVVDVEAKANIITGGMFHGGDSWFTALEELYLPETATAVETHAFAINPSLRILHLGNVSAFTGTSIMDTRSLLEAVYCYADALPTLDGEFAFYENPQANATLFVSYGLKSAYEAAPEWGGFKEIREVANVKSPGTLAAVLGAHVATDSLLCLAGDLNATDINTIRNMPMLKILDMRLANIVEGGEYYVYGNEPRTTQNNVVRGDMFQQDGMAAPLETVYIPNSTKVFEGELPNTFIKHVWLNEGLREINGQTFYYSYSLQELYIPASVKRMDTSHYWEHNYEIEVHPDNTAYASVDGVLYSKDMSKLLLFPGNRTGSFTVPASVKTVGNTAFARSRLTEVIMQEGVTTLERYAFYSADALQRVEVPQSVTEVGYSCFNGSTGLLSVVWNTSASMIRAFQYERWNEVTQQSDWFDMEINQPNAIIYVKSGVEVNKLWKNVVVDGMAEEIVLRGKGLHEWRGMEQYSFYASKPFKAKKISYMYSFNRSDWDKSVEYETGRNISGGWQIITLPFTPTRIYHEEKGELAPFNSNVAGAKPFWLRKLTTAGFQSQTSIQPNTPYIIAMPNHKTYDEQYNIVGDVYFTAESEEGIDVAATPEMVEVEGAQYVMHGIYQPIFSEEYHGNESVPGIYCLNYDYSTTVDGKDYAIGSIFLRDRGMATAFTGYVTSKENSASTRAPLYYSIGDSGSVTGLEEIVSREDTSLKVYVLGKVLCIESETARQLSIYDATGRTIRQVQVKEGLNQVTGLAPGYYFMEGRKVLIK